MRYLLLISTLTTSLVFSAGSWAEWTQVAERSGAKGTEVYVDFDRIRKVNGLVYYWELSDIFMGTSTTPEPSSTAFLSTKIYYKVDCETMRQMKLSMSVYNLPMGEGDGRTYPPKPNPQWNYAQPESVLEARLEAVCNH